MSDVPLLKRVNIDFVDSWELRAFEDVHPSHRTAVIELSIIEDALRKFQKAELFHIDPTQKMLIDCIKCKKFFKNGYSVLNIEDAISYFYCKDCWEIEVFGVLESQDKSVTENNNSSVSEKEVETK